MLDSPLPLAVLGQAELQTAAVGLHEYFPSTHLRWTLTCAVAPVATEKIGPTPAVT